MAEFELKARIKQKLKTLEEWAVEEEFVPLKGEICYAVDNGKLFQKIGDGQTQFSKLPWLTNQADWNETDINSPSFVQNKIGGYIEYNDTSNLLAALTGDREGDSGFEGIASEVYLDMLNQDENYVGLIFEFSPKKNESWVFNPRYPIDIEVYINDQNEPVLLLQDYYIDNKLGLTEEELSGEDIVMYWTGNVSSIAGPLLGLQDDELSAFCERFGWAEPDYTVGAFVQTSVQENSTLLAIGFPLSTDLEEISSFKTALYGHESYLHPIPKTFLEINESDFVGQFYDDGTGEIFNDYGNLIASGIYSHAEGTSRAKNETLYANEIDHLWYSTIWLEDDYNGIGLRFEKYIGCRCKVSWTYLDGTTGVADTFLDDARYGAIDFDSFPWGIGETVDTTKNIYFTFYSGIASGSASHVEGCNNIAVAECGHAEGEWNNLCSDAKGSHVEGKLNVVYGSYSHVEGYSNKLQGHGTSSGDHIEGRYNTSVFRDDEFLTPIHVEGCCNTASLDGNHIEGRGSAAFGELGHIEGFGGYGKVSFNNLITRSLVEWTEIAEHKFKAPLTPEQYDLYCFEGGLVAYRYRWSSSTTSTTYTEYAEIKETTYVDGVATITLTDRIFPFGTTVYGQTLEFCTQKRISSAASGAHVEGIGTYIATSGGHAQGRFNSIDSGSYAHVVGNGESSDNRSNAHTLDWNGNAWYAGKITGQDFINPNWTEKSLTNRLNELETTYLTYEIASAITATDNEIVVSITLGHTSGSSWSGLNQYELRIAKFLEQNSNMFNTSRLFPELSGLKIEDAYFANSAENWSENLKDLERLQTIYGAGTIEPMRAVIENNDLYLKYAIKLKPHENLPAEQVKEIIDTLATADKLYIKVPEKINIID